MMQEVEAVNYKPWKSNSMSERARKFEFQVRFKSSFISFNQGSVIEIRGPSVYERLV